MAESAGAASPRRPPRLRGRLVVVAGVVVVLLASGFGLQRGLGARPAPAGRAEPSRSGAWFCPHGGGEGWRGWVWVTNPGASAVRVRITTFDQRGVAARSTFVVPPLHQVQRTVPATQRAASTEVEYFGGWVAAATVVRSVEPDGTAAERCVPGARRRWFVPDAPTAPGDESFLVVMNPFAQDASFDVVIRTDRRPPVRPGSLSPFVVPAGTSASLPLSEFVLQAPDERVVGAEIDMRLGRVVAGGVTVSASGVDAETAIAAASETWTLPAAGYEPPSSLAVLNPGTRRADLEIVAQSDSSQKAISGIGDISLGSGDLRLLDLGDLADAGVVIRSTNHVPVVAVRRAQGTQADGALVPGSPTAAARWIVLPGTPPTGGRSLVVLQNSGRTDARIVLMLIGRGGEVAAPSIDHLTVGAARTAIVDLSTAVGGRPITVVVTAVGGTVVAGAASYSVGGDGYASTLGETVPMNVVRPSA